MTKKKLKSTVVIGLVGLFGFSLALTAFFYSIQNPVYAASSTSAVAVDYGITVTNNKVDNAPSDLYSIEWIDAAHLELSFKGKPDLKLMFTPKNEADNGQGALKDQRNNHADVDYGISGWPCYANAHAGQSIDKQVEKLDIDIDYKPSGAGECQNINTINDLQSIHPELSIAYFKWIDAGKIDYVDDGSTLSFQQVDPAYPNIFAGQGSSCIDKLLVDPSSNTVKYYELDQDYTGDPPPDIQTGGGCKFHENTNTAPTSNKSMPLAGLANKSKPIGSGTSAAASGGGTVEESNCETSGFGLSWITCPIINGLSGVTGGVFTHIIEPYLKTTPIDTTADANNSIFKAWSGIRNIANIVLIFALLFVVFGQAIGGGLIDAYTAKKIMPRLLAAAVLINISIYIVAILIDIFNVLGSGIGNLVLGPFKDTIFRHFNPDKGGGKGIAIGLIIAAIIGIILAKVTDGVFKHGSNGSIGVGSAVMPFIHFLLVFVLIPGVLISLAIFATLIIRQGLILILVVTAPLAFAFFALPSTEKYFKKWWETLSATLMVYPIMTVIFSASIIMASLAYNVGDNIDVPLSGFIGAIVAFIILIVPLALIPFSFKLAGGLLGNVMNVTKGLGSKGGGFGKNRYKEQKGLERKSLFEQKWNNNEVGARTRYNAKRAGREPYWSEKRDQVAGIGSGRTASRVRGGFSRLTHGSTPSPEAVAAGAAAAAVAGGGPASGLARVAAIDAYSSAVGTHGAAAASASAAAAGVAAGRGSNRTVASNVGAAAAAAHVAAAASGTVTAQAANAAAYSAGEAIEMGRPPEAARSAGAAAGASYDRFTTTHGLSGPEATVASGVVGQAAAGIHATEALRSGNHVTAGAEAATGAVVAENAYAGALNSRHEGPAAAHTAAIASGEAFIDLKASIGGGTTRLTNAEVNRAATAASGAHVAAATGGANETVARQQGIFAGRAVR